MNHIIWIVFDSARFDAFLAARTPNLDSIGTVERRWSYCSWTAPSHLTFFMGITPHKNKKNVFASNQYREDLLKWIKRINLESQSDIFTGFVPALSLPLFLKNIGYHCRAYVSLPVLNGDTILSRHFDHYELMPTHNCFHEIIEKITFDETPSFHFINTGETHYPYLLPNETISDLPRLSGLHGVMKNLDDFLANPSSFINDEPAKLFNSERLKVLYNKQIVCIEYLDDLIGTLLQKSPSNTWFIVTSDHGELFGEDGFFGHGPIFHEKVLEVFFLEGMLP